MIVSGTPKNLDRVFVTRKLLVLTVLRAWKFLISMAKHSPLASDTNSSESHLPRGMCGVLSLFVRISRRVIIQKKDYAKIAKRHQDLNDIARSFASKPRERNSGEDQSRSRVCGLPLSILIRDNCAVRSSRERETPRTKILLRAKFARDMRRSKRMKKGTCEKNVFALNAGFLTRARARSHGARRKNVYFFALPEAYSIRKRL